MKKLLLLASISFVSNNVMAAPMGKLPIMASRANCVAITPVGIGPHNESMSWYWRDSHDMWVKSQQQSKRGTTRSVESASTYEWTWRAYAGFVDAIIGSYKDWTVEGQHATRFSLTNINTTSTKATTCNLSEGWPWSK